MTLDRQFDALRLPRLLDPGRLTALRDLGLTKTSDPGMERFAQRVRDDLAVPVSLVSLVQADEQVFPGMCGLPAPWDERRSTPLSHSFCQHVIETGEPLVISDARRDPLVATNLATTEIGVVAYAGMPLTDDEGHVLGSLCAIDTQPRVWTETELRVLRDIAHDCSTELRLRLARLDATRERDRRDVLEEQLRHAFTRSQRLLTIAEQFNETRTLDEVRRVVGQLVDGTTSGVAHVALRLPGDAHEPSDRILASRADRRSVVHVTGLPAIAAVAGADVAEHYRAAGLRSVACTEGIGSLGSLGLIELGWADEKSLDDGEVAMITALGSYAGQALERAMLIEDRISAAHTLQDAMLSPVPLIDGLDLAAGYLPARSGERVGGDWYDVVVVPNDDEDVVSLTVGDVTGHDIAAAALMGQARAMLRQASWDHPGSSPSAQLSALERAVDGLHVGLTGTAVVAHLRQTSPGWSMTWTNAGHPPPIVIDAEGHVQEADGHDLMLGYPDLLDGPRTDHHAVLAPGSTLVLHTDGITDRRDVGPDEAVEQLVEIVSGLRQERAETVVRAVIEAHGHSDDDVVCLVVRVPS